ncbi:MAG: prolyl oligopeptidase family serine peptidase [Candidatus Cybelea sp.]
MTLKRRALLSILTIGLVAAASPTPPPAPAVRDVTTVYHGVSVPDPYRYFEDPKDPGLAAYFREQSAYTRQILDALPGRPALRARVAQLDNGNESLNSVRVVGSYCFYLKRTPGANTTKLYRRRIAGGPERLVFDPGTFARSSMQHYTFDYYSVSPDGRFAAIGTAEGGSEKTELRVVDVQNGHLLSDVIKNAIYFGPQWLSDSRSFYYFRTPDLGPDAPQSARDTKGVVRFHVLGRNPNLDPAIFGYGLSPRIPFAPEDAAMITVSPRTGWAVAAIYHGVQNEIALYAVPASQATNRQGLWRKIVGYEDDVTDFEVVDNTLYLSSHLGAPRHRILAVDLRSPSLANAREAVAQSGRVIEALSLAADGIYLQDLDGGISQLRRIAIRADGTLGSATEVALPFDGTISEIATDPLRPGVIFDMESWTKSPLWYRASATTQVRDMGLRKKSPVDYSGIVAREVFAKSADGTDVPLSVVMRADLARNGENPTLLDGYGAYGIAITPSFSPTRLAWLERGGIFAECHVRGGGEFGEDWHFAAHIATKQRTVDDFVGCAHYLIDNGYTTSAKLAGTGTSAGGVTIGNAIVQHPELFRAALDVVGDTNPTRDEFAEGGPANIPEFGSVTDPVGFKALYETDPYIHIRDGVAYPAVLAITGANDPRVAPWIVAKFAARLQAATSSGRPVLLRVDYDAGHGALGASRTQTQALITDEYAFLFWQLGEPITQ